ncbi:MAG: TIGR03808 family TAT-translocated repetitive protein, partial [Hyphomicrobiales bacterium]|nr:TIGR03808 family TAT-translocated repetitive protein [Hyphomicrobiales bacterium]
TGNVIENASRIGIRIGFGPNLRDVAASGNVIQKAAIGIAVSVSTGSGQATISDNIISEARDGAIIGMDHLEISTGDLAINSRRVPPHLQISGNKIG